MPQYIKKPVAVHAQQIELGVPREPWLAPYFESGEIWATPKTYVYAMKTKHGIVEARPGDWILQSPTDGEIYPCDDATFRATYDLAPPGLAVPLSFQQRCFEWAKQCFTPEVVNNLEERTDRFVEEAMELAQSLGYNRERAHALVDYVFDRPIGDPDQEVGGTLVTMAVMLSVAPYAGKIGIDMADAGECELLRINNVDTMARIQMKQKTKPTGSALPQ